MMTTQEFVTRPEFDKKMHTIDKKFDEFTDTMVKQFDRMYVYMDGRFGSMDNDLYLIKNAFSALERSLKRIEEHLGIKAS